MAHMEAGRTIVADIDVARASARATAQEVTGWLADYVTLGRSWRCSARAGEGLAPNARKSRIRGHANPEDLFLLEG